MRKNLVERPLSTTGKQRKQTDKDIFNAQQRNEKLYQQQKFDFTVTGKKLYTIKQNIEQQHILSVI